MDEDTRPDCRYGSLCYQKNPEHHAKFKHSFKRKERNSDVEQNDNSKKLKHVNDKPRTSNTPKDSKSPRNKNQSPLLKNKEKISPKADKQSKEQTKNQIKDEHSKTSPVKRTSELNIEETESPTEQEQSIGKRDSKKRDSGCKSPNESFKKEENVNSKDNLNELEKEESDLNISKQDAHIEDKNSGECNREKLNTSGEVNININNVLIEDTASLKATVKEKYLVQMPEEFFTFWKLCQKISPKCPKDAFKCIDLKLVGPFDILNGQVVEDGLMVTHWRYFFDPPEFQTILVSTAKDQLHYGYFRDEPDQDPVFIASNSNKECKINPAGSNIFMFIHEQLDSEISKAHASPTKSKLTHVKQKLTDFAQGHKIDLESPKLSSVVRARKAKTVCKGLSGIGVVVPYVKKTELGYRPLQKSDKELETLFRQYKDPSVDPAGRLKLKSILQEVSNWVTIAIDESDFGTGLEFGLDLFGSGVEELHEMTKCTLGVAYQYLYRDEFGKILEAHLANRDRDHINLLQHKK